MTALADDAQDPLLLRSFGVPFRAIARAFGKDPMRCYRLEPGLGSNSIVGTTVRRADVPEHLLAGEHHQTRDAVKNYLATTAGAARRRGSTNTATMTTGSRTS